MTSRHWMIHAPSNPGFTQRLTISARVHLNTSVRLYECYHFFVYSSLQGDDVSTTAWNNKMIVRSSRFWNVRWHRLVVTDVSEQPFDPIFKNQAVQEDCLTLENGTDNLWRNVGS
jgi:hypothetical protein